MTFPYIAPAAPPSNGGPTPFPASLVPIPGAAGDHRLETKIAPIDARVALVLAQLQRGELANAPFIQPRHVAPLLGITQNQFTAYCRQCRQAQAWRGQWRFFLDDPGHVAVLGAIIRLALWSGRKLPAALRVNDSTRVH
jgi:hypothetical protein